MGIIEGEMGSEGVGMGKFMDLSRIRNSPSPYAGKNRDLPPPHSREALNHSSLNGMDIIQSLNFAP